MSDLISRQAVLALPRDRIRNMRGEIVKETIDVAYIEQLPSAEPQRKKGKWIIISDGWFDAVRCDQCGKMQEDISDFCPSCGADMRGEQ